jgi:hypothetical protein
MAEIVVGLLTAFFTAIPAVLNILEGRRAERKGTRDALTKRSLDELAAGVDGVLGHSPVQPK